MKKLVFIFMAIVFTSTAIAKEQANCVSLSLDVFDNNGYTYAEAYQASNWAYEGCVSNGGYAGNTVVLDME